MVSIYFIIVVISTLKAEVHNYYLIIDKYTDHQSFKHWVPK